MDQFYAQLRSEATQKAEQVRERLAKETVSWDVRVDDAMFAEAPRSMARQARYADLAILAAPDEAADEAPISRAFFSAMLFESGRPVLAVPPRQTHEGPLRHAVVAWKPTPGIHPGGP
ncbi:hypothetical protein [Agrilutibacter solisilvae]|uniref:Universal stress protein n=1 Tax=Agrilutibacter solisilvae TaxID=2763317 RepID=A0A975AS72_9GAMM|nr:hypothetical protein [Lysobacter solisilvae]QSX77769.1 hypothetical protein I8J32_013675 [Lysobacter solisilvae]